jgi:hypothetical protein
MAGAVVVHPQMQARVLSGTTAIVTASTYEDGRVLPRCFILCRHLVRGFILLCWLTGMRGSLRPPRSVLAAALDRLSPSALASPRAATAASAPMPASATPCLARGFTSDPAAWIAKLVR